MDQLRTLVVVTKAKSQDLVTLEDARSEVGVADHKYDARLRRYITQSSAAIASYTRRVWREEEVQETFYRSYYQSYWNPYWNPYAYSNWQRWRWLDRSAQPIVLARYPVGSIESVIELSNGQTIDPSKYFLDADFGLVYNWDADAQVIFPWTGAETLQITYKAGYDPIEDIPPDVQQACLTQIRRRYWGSTRDPTLRSVNVANVQEETYWVGQLGENGAILPEAIGLLAPHVDMRS